MSSLPIILRRGRPFLDTLNCPASLQRAVCPREKFISFLDGTGNLNIHLLADDLQSMKVDNVQFMKYMWVVPCNAVQDCILDTKLDNNSELLAVTSSLDFHWYSVSDRTVPISGSEDAAQSHVEPATLTVELLAVLKKTELSTKLRKLHFSALLDEIVLLGSDDGLALLLLNSSLVCRLVLDHEFGVIALAGCHVLQLSLEQYQDDHLPASPGLLVTCAYSNPLLFALTASGITFICNVNNGACIGLVSVKEYCHYFYSRMQDSEAIEYEFELLAVSPDLSLLTVSLSSNHMILINLPEYYQMFPHHYHPSFIAGGLKSQHTSKTVSLAGSADISREEEEERGRCGFSSRLQKEKFIGSFPGNYAWTCRLDTLGTAVEAFHPEEMEYLNLYATSVLPDSPLSECSEGSKVPPNWYEVTQSEVAKNGMAASTISTASFVSGIQKKISARPGKNDNIDVNSTLYPFKCHYDNHWLLPAASQKKSQLLKVDFVSNLIVAYWSQDNSQDPSQGVAVGMAIYAPCTRSYSYVRLPQPNWLIHNSLPDQLVYLANEQSLSVIAFNLTQEEYVGKVLMFGSASVAEEVCHLNRWDQCSLPINALETALELRQLDTLAFFLRSRDNDAVEEEPSQAADVPALPPLPPEHLDTAIQLLTSAIERNSQEEHNQQFAIQLLHMTLGFITRMIRNEVKRDEMSTLVSGQVSEQISTEENKATTSLPLRKLTSYIQHLRTFLPDPSVVRRGEGKQPEEGKESLSEQGDSYVAAFIDRAMVTDWDKLNPKEVIKEALLRGCLPLAQAYLLQRKPEDMKMGYGFNRQLSIEDALDDGHFGQKLYPSSVSSHCDVSLKAVQVTAIGYMVHSLQKRNIKLATRILRHLGLDAFASLRHVCFNTLDVELRNFLSKELAVQKQLSDVEVSALEYMHILETYYLFQSYDQAYEQRPKSTLSGKSAFQATVLPVIPGIVSRTTIVPSLGNLQDLYPEKFGGDYGLIWDPAVPSSSSNVCLYLQVPLAAVLCWDDATRQRMLFESFVLTRQSEGAECRRIMKERHVFDYYVGHDDTAKTVEFVLNKTPPLENSTVCPPYIVSLCSTITNSTAFLYDTLLDELARNGVFIPVELHDFPTFLRRLGRINALFTLPHPLSKVAGQLIREDFFSEEEQKRCSIVSVDSFHKTFLQYLVQNRFFSLMYHYLDSHGLGLDEVSISELGLVDGEQPWVDVLLQYRLAALSPQDTSSVFQASLSCSNLLLSPDLNSHKMSIMGMLQNERTLMAIASLMYAPVPLEEAINEANSGELWYADPSFLHQAIAAYPSLQAAIFPPSPTSLTPAQSQDITLYELLQDNVPFDVGRLFKWQDTNTVAPAHEEVEICTYELPQFSSPALAKKFALSEHLDYVYYLQRGQPSFAFANFIAARLINHSNPKKRINQLMSRVYKLAVRDFSNVRLGASCAALMEMLGKDSTALRIDLQCINRICKYTSDMDASKLHVDSSLHRKLATQFSHLHKSHDAGTAADLLLMLEAATGTMISHSGVEICGLEAEECWQLVQSFCVYHHLPPSVAFLTVCAENGHWLPLLCNAQLNGIASQKVLSIVEKSFTNPFIKEHLALAISSMDSTEQPSSPLFIKGSESHGRRSGSLAKSAATGKTQTLVSAHPDLRVKFYSRVGLQREVTPQPEPKSFHVGDDGDREEEQTAASHERVPTPPPPLTILPPPLVDAELPTDLFSVIFKSQMYECGWRALLAHAIALQRPLLAILAACYEDSSAVECTCVWLFSLLSSSMFDKLTLLLEVNGEVSVQPEGQLRNLAEMQWRCWSTLDLSLMLISAMQHSPSPASHFSLAFKHFDKNSPLLSFLRFHEEFVLHNNYEESKKHLNEFQLNMDKCKSYGFVGVIGDILWVEQVTSSMASHMLVICPTPFERFHLLHLLSETHFGENFKCSVLDFSELYQMSCVLSEAGLASDAAFTIKEHFSTVPGLKSLSEIYSVRVRVDTDYVLGLLLERGQFNIARKYASIVKSTTSQVTIKEAEFNLNQLRKSSYWDYEQARLNFWHQCNLDFHNAGVEPESAADFFHSIIVNSEVSATVPEPLVVTPMEKSLLLALALKWRQSNANFDTEHLQELERDIWLSHVHSTVEEIENLSNSNQSGSPVPFFSEDDHSTSSLFSRPGQTSLLSSLSVTAQKQFKGRRQLTEFVLPDNVSVALEGKSRTTLCHKEAEAFDMMLGRLMNAGLLSQARQLASIFEHDSPDLTIVLCCIQLCQGKLAPSQLTEGVLSLVKARPPRHLNDPDGPLLEDPNHSTQASEIIRMLNTLSDRATYAQQCCSCIITCFRIALALNLSYASVITTEPFDTLTQLLGSSASDRIMLASKFISTCNLEPNKIAGFLSECIATSLQAKYGGPGNPSDSPKARVYQHQMTSSQFHELAQLSSDPTLLGNLLLDMSKSLVSVDSDSREDITMQVELLIRSHDCYTLGCSVDGISNVLIVAQNWVQKLVEGKHFKLMVRLLTGISRYHEMGYIIGLLIEHDQFESLVNKGVEKEEQLRVALIEYLRKHGSDNEKLQMVALHFGMPRELAKTMEDQAKKELAQIKPKHLVTSNHETLRKLKKIFDGFRDAAKTYSKEHCLNSAEHCLSQARLVALQLSVLSKNKQVINLEPKAVLKYMEDQPFSEALVVSDAYKHGVWADWVNPLFKRVVLGGDFRYLGEFKTAFCLTPAVFNELAGKYQREKDKTPEAAYNMKKLLGDLKLLTLRQKLATDLGLTDLIHPRFDAGYMNDIQRL